jgi:pyruvate kinase
LDAHTVTDLLLNPAPSSPERSEIRSIIHELEALHDEMLDLVRQNRGAIDSLHEDHRPSAANLLHYLALRRHDFRGLQERLASLGLSSLGRTEADVISAVRKVLHVLAMLDGDSAPSFLIGGKPAGVEDGRCRLEHNTQRLLGPVPEQRNVRIMVTIPSEGASNYDLIRDLLSGGMNCMRINCAHDGPEAWSAMIRNLRSAEQETGRRCKIAMDLAGPKLRTGPVGAGPSVVKVRPHRDMFGRTVRAARIWLTAGASSPAHATSGDAWLPVPEAWRSALEVNDVIRFVDARGARRAMLIRETSAEASLAECAETAYITPGIRLTVSRPHTRGRSTRVGEIPPRPLAPVLRTGDRLTLTRSLAPGQPAQYDHAGNVVHSARIGVSLPEFFESVKTGEPIWLDDGKFGGVISETGTDEVTVDIRQAPIGGAKLGPEKGINVPETALRVASLTEEDRAAIPFIAEHADIVAYSFVRTEEDVRELQLHLKALNADHLGVVLKIETREGFENLPGLLLAALRSGSVGVMIARGDLAIECGYERLAELQEEILWISEAAHAPVIWATQVLETLTKTGMPSRSEITDAAMGERAECVMLNKGPFVVDAVKTLDSILRRMQDHQQKKRSMLRQLRLATGFRDVES